MAPLFLAVEPRFSLALLNVGGFYLQAALPEADPVNFAPRVKIPVLMLNGRFDFFFPTETSQEPMFRGLGTPPEHKRQRRLRCRAHDAAERSDQGVRRLDGRGTGDRRGRQSSAGEVAEARARFCIGAPVARGTSASRRHTDAPDGASVCSGGVSGGCRVRRMS